MKEPIFPPATIGILGSGQLGRMLAGAARQMGYGVQVYGPGPDSPAGQLADVSWTNPYDDLDQVQAFARAVDVITYEFENIPLSTARAAAAFAPLRPGLEPLRIAQNRLREKSFLQANGLPVAPFRAIKRPEDIKPLDWPLPAVLKTAESGYDGKGQLLIEDYGQALSAWLALGGRPAVLEAFLELEKEISVIIGRDILGRTAVYGPIENRHAHHILDISSCPAEIDRPLQDEALKMAAAIAAAFDLVGVICVEFFITATGRLLVNEIAPRPHNSGHLTIESHITSQFEQQLRTVCGLPVGSSVQRQPAAMANLLGDLWQEGPPAWDQITNETGLKVHLYGKKEARPGRKMGHLTVCAPSAAAAVEIVKSSRARLLSAHDADFPNSPDQSSQADGVSQQPETEPSIEKDTRPDKEIQTP